MGGSMCTFLRGVGGGEGYAYILAGGEGGTFEHILAERRRGGGGSRYAFLRGGGRGGGGYYVLLRYETSKVRYMQC